jgi:hypothetical protein
VAERGSRRFRVHERREVRLSAAVLHLTDGWRADGRVTNVSLGGACLELPRPVNDGAELRVEVIAPSLWDPLGLRARVMWSYFPEGHATGKLGIAFDHDDGPSVLALFELICSFDFG